MKYMTFNSSCSYAGVANMLEQHGVDSDDRSIAIRIKLPYLFSHENGVYMAGPMLQSADWFNLYLNPIGFNMVEKEVLAEQVPTYLMQQKTAMLGLQVDESGKHAVVYTGQQDGKLLFLNNKWEHTIAPEQIALSEDELVSQISNSVMIATLDSITPKTVDLLSKIRNSVAVIRQNLLEIQIICSREESVGQLRSRLNTLFRPLLLDGITMLNLLGEGELAQRFSSLQCSFLNALKQNADMKIKLGDYLNVNELDNAAREYIRLIEQAG